MLENPIYAKKILLAVTPTDLLVMSEDIVVPSLLERINQLYPGLTLTMSDYNAQLKGLGRRKLCDKITESFPDRVSGRVLDVTEIYKGRDAACMDAYANIGTKMADGAIEALTEVKGMGVELVLVSNNSVQRGTRAIKSADNKRGDELLRLFDGNFYEAQSFQSQDPAATVGTALEYFCRHEKVEKENTLVFCRASGVQSFADAGFANIIGSIGGSKTIEKDAEKLKSAGAIEVVGPLSDLPAAISAILKERILQPDAHGEPKTSPRSKQHNK